MKRVVKKYGYVPAGSDPKRFRFEKENEYEEYTRDDGTKVYFVSGDPCDLKEIAERFGKLKKSAISSGASRLEKEVIEEDVIDAFAVSGVLLGYDLYYWAIENYEQEQKAKKRNSKIVNSASAYAGFNIGTDDAEEFVSDAYKCREDQSKIIDLYEKLKNKGERL